jgi:beta propeller repeat protein
LEILNIYGSPDFSHLPIGAQPAGSQASIVDGPVTDADGFTWWKLDYDTGSDGWVAGRYIAQVPPPAGLLLTSEVRLTNYVAVRSHPRVYGDKVVWADVRNGGSDIT